MRSSNELFELIKSLEKSEKRYFRLFCSFHGGNKKYMLVFNAIEKQKKYDEKSILTLFKKEKFATHFPVVKQYLYNLVLSSMESYHSNTESELNSQLHRVTILYEKGLYAQCKKLIAKAKLLAIKYDLQLPLLELLRWELKLMSKQSFIGATEDKIKLIFNDIANSVEQYKTNNDYLLHIYLLFLSEMKSGNIRNNAEIKALKKIIDNPLFRINEKELSFQSQYLFYTAYGAYFFLQNDYFNSFIYQGKLIQLLDENPHQILKNPLQYAQGIHNFFVCNLSLKKYQECAIIIEKLKKVQVKSSIGKTDIDFRINEMTLMLYLEIAAFNKGVQLIESTEEKWDKMDSSKISKGRILMLQYNKAYLYFATGNYHKANEYLNKMLNEPMDIRKDDQCFARILSLIVHFEMGKQDLLEYEVKSIHRFLYKRERLYKVENLILEFISKELPTIHSDKELLKSFESLLIKMKAIANDPFEQRAFDYFDFISWVESKVENRPFAEIVKEKALVH